MSIPTSKILKASKSIMAIAELRNHSPANSNSQNVNVFVGAPTPADKKVVYPKVDEVEGTEKPAEGANPYDGAQIGEAMTRDIESAMAKTKEIEDTIAEKDNTIKALSLIIEILQGNPLIVNKFVVAEEPVLTELIRLLTSADSVEIDTKDIECSCSAPKYKVIKRIIINKDNEMYSVTQCPIILRLFDDYKISLNIVA